MIHKLLSLAETQELIQKIEKNNIAECLYGVPNGPTANPAKSISVVLLFVIGIVTLFLKRKSSWKIKAIIIIVTLIGIFIAAKINWNTVFKI